MIGAIPAAHKTLLSCWVLKGLVLVECCEYLLFKQSSKEFPVTIGAGRGSAVSLIVRKEFESVDMGLKVVLIGATSPTCGGQRMRPKAGTKIAKIFLVSIFFALSENVNIWQRSLSARIFPGKSSPN